MITSTHNPKVQRVRALQGRAKEGREQNAFLVEGVRLAEEAQAAGWPFEFVLLSRRSSPRLAVLQEKLERQGVEVEEIDGPILQSLSETEASQGILAVLERKNLPLPAQADFVLILDQMRDPGNLGTLLRSAAAAGVQAAFLPPETADAFTPKVVRSGMGAHVRLPIRSQGWDEICRSVAAWKLSVYLAEMDAAVPCWQADFRGPLALIVGGEAEGASRRAGDLADHHVSIPMPGGTESLNAAVAGAILMYEVTRQRAT